MTELINAGSTSSLISSDLTVDMTDVLAIAVSRAETMMQGKVEENKETHSKLSADAAALEEEANVECLEHAKSIYEEEVGEYLAAHKKLFKEELVVSFDVQIRTEAPPVRNSGLKKPKKWHPNYYLEVCFSGHIGPLCEEVKLPASILSKIKEVKKLREAANAAQTEAVVWRRKLQNIPKLERQYRARIAEQKLVQTQEGKDIVQTLVGNIEQDVLTLAPA